MGSYHNLWRVTSDCVHFIYDDPCNELDPPNMSMLSAARIKLAYSDAQELSQDIDLINSVARALQLEHAPYEAPKSNLQPSLWLPFSDDLITLAHREAGLVIAIDNAGSLLSTNSKGMFNLIEAFLSQFHHWLEQKKACHLCFQMTKSSWVKTAFET